MSYVVKVPFTTSLFQFSNPPKGDIIVFRYPIDKSKDFIKRVIAKEATR
jgi:signal peptidase I